MADVFALGIYGLVVFPKVFIHIDEAISDLFDRLSKGVTPIPAILAETFRSLNACRRADHDVKWRAPWLIPDEILYRCGDLDWVPLLGIWEVVGYAPLLVSRQFRSRQFIPATQGLAQCKFSYKEDNYKKKVQEMSNAWNRTRRMKILAVGLEHLRVLPSKMEIIKQEFEKRSLELGKKIEQLEEKNAIRIGCGHSKIRG
ncbi:hypothetical protein Goshw_014230 [Gossypium schwendimanii]|uniref:DUF7745 domain-containing protein n=1 Tax=Gossypium schwendimanii TaxID=34291 RepID=A0A7J9NFA6_GOSSC|nr:hypothetical protein [Gossypium schwendimanii]